MKRKSSEIAVALATAVLIALAGLAVSTVDRLQAQYLSQRSERERGSVDSEFLARFRSEGGDAGSCWESIE